jgi:vacuolar-type H+-ATPase subunit B/Vma2
MGWELLKLLPENELKRVKPEHIEKYMNKGEKKAEVKEEKAENAEEE